MTAKPICLGIFCKEVRYPVTEYVFLKPRVEMASSMDLWVLNSNC